ncbi:hypothetical protein RSOLAG22IIIB_08896 [Rhizoctonia solani]|uniref:DUF6593 domain-containing protein n=1 Tax=Rhizoctonia solani TaxID=456999 RepID=A0A0K6FWD8_9AGAM|nr:hypothetical protein RSOLAG22IIIB_08896 [Rhizoctonia solani]
MSESTIARNLQLVFSKDNPSNTVLTPLDEPGPAYSVVAKLQNGSDMITTFRKSEQGPTDDWENTPVIATLRWREIFSDKISLGGNPFVSVSSIFKKRFMSTTVSFSDNQDRKYEWRGYGAGLEMVLFEKGGKEGIAGFKRSRLDHTSQKLHPAILTLSPRAMEIMDLVVVSFLALEKNRRMDDNSSNNKADAMTSSAIGVGNVTGNDNIHNHGV